MTVVRLSRQARSKVIVAAVMFIFVAVNVYLWRTARSDDWSSIFVAARLIARGQLHAIYDHDPGVFTSVSPHFDAAAAEVNFRGVGHTYVHIPLLAFALGPFARPGSFTLSSQILVVANVLATLGLVWLTAKIFDNRLTQAPALAVVLLAVTVSEPMRYSLFLGQTTPLVLFTMVYAIYLAGKHHPIPAGLLLALGTAIKLTPAIVAVYWLCQRRQRRSAFSFAAWMAAIGTASLVLVGWQSQVEYLHTLRRIAGSGLPTFNNQSVVGWLLTNSVAGMPGRLFHFAVVPISPAVRLLNLALLLLAAAVVVGLYVWIRRAGDWDWRRRDLERLVIASLFLLPLIFTPISWTHYYLAMVVPILALSSAHLERKTQWGWVLIVLLVLLNLQPVAIDTVGATLGILTHAHLLSGVLAMGALVYLALPTRNGARRSRGKPAAARETTEDTTEDTTEEPPDESVDAELSARPRASKLQPDGVEPSSEMG